LSGIILLVIAIGAFIVGYLTYGAYVARRLGIDPQRPTPAQTMKDGIDYVPTRAPVLLGHHFASISGAGPIVGPVVAAAFGWVPVFLWIVLGGIFIGAVHDLSALVSSIRHRAKSIGEIIGENVGISGKKLFAAFAWLALILVLAVFAVVIAKMFVGTPEAATASSLFVVLAVVFGFAVYQRGAPLAVTSVAGVALLCGCVGLGVLFPFTLPFKVWVVVLLVYAFVASCLPIWILLQPRDYLNSFLLYGFLIGAVIGILATNPSIKLPAFTGFETNLGYLFPILFVTVACGAISGFHSLVSSGTSSKQLSNEAHARPIGYGGMLLECLLAVIALSTVAVLVMSDYKETLKDLGWGGTFAKGVGGFLTGIGIPLAVGKGFGALVLSAFALTTLDTATRIGRFVFAELAEREGKAVSAGVVDRIVPILTNRYVGGAICVICAGALALSGTWKQIWPLFGSANQLLAGLALLAVAVWLATLGRSNRFVVLPMIFMFAVTLTALVVLFLKTIAAANYLLACFAVALFILAIILLYLAITRLIAVRGKKPAASG